LILYLVKLKSLFEALHIPALSILDICGYIAAIPFTVLLKAENKWSMASSQFEKFVEYIKPTKQHYYGNDEPNSSLSAPFIISNVLKTIGYFFIAVGRFMENIIEYNKSKMSGGGENFTQTADSAGLAFFEKPDWWQTFTTIFEAINLLCDVINFTVTCIDDPSKQNIAVEFFLLLLSIASFVTDKLTKRYKKDKANAICGSLFGCAYYILYFAGDQEDFQAMGGIGQSLSILVGIPDVMSAIDLSKDPKVKLAHYLTEVTIRLVCCGLFGGYTGAKTYSSNIYMY